jgi:hypothetical protein
MDEVFGQSLSREILAESAHGECVTREFDFPVFVVLKRVAIHSLVLASMHSEVRLSIVIEIECPQGDPTWDRLLIDRCRYTSPMPNHFPRQPAIEGHKFHINCLIQ